MATWFDNFRAEMAMERDDQVQLEIEVMASVHSALSRLTTHRARERVVDHIMDLYDQEARIVREMPAIDRAKVAPQ